MHNSVNGTFTFKISFNLCNTPGSMLCEIPSLLSEYPKYKHTSFNFTKSCQFSKMIVPFYSPHNTLEEIGVVGDTDFQLGNCVFP